MIALINYVYIINNTNLKNVVNNCINIIFRIFGRNNNIIILFRCLN